MNLVNQFYHKFFGKKQSKRVAQRRRKIDIKIKMAAKNSFAIFFRFSLLYFHKN